MARKTFKPQDENPAEAFIQDGKKEIKSGRFNLQVYPRLKADLEKIAYIQQTTLNDIMNRAFEEYIGNHKDDIDLYYQFLELKKKAGKGE